eukprot:TRINITY_DN25367_c0_g1_i1.p1 TRINITY_DN25367_c0_g1~~TRINITY_DN25367_c0_g1_i1.p1  ORF type:complete len:169 (-),score=47.86 TRINITY_DN25367_c0_g1_i1:156-662(-)
MEDYYGNTGAFRCLVEGGGDVAFVKHTTVMENCDGKRKEWWARNQLTSDYQLLCRDGTRRKATDYRDCYLGKVKANAMVTNPEYPPYYIDAFINLFKYAQQFYGQKMKNEFSFSMFYSEPPFADLFSKMLPRKSSFFQKTKEITWPILAKSLQKLMKRLSVQKQYTIE